MPVTEFKITDIPTTATLPAADDYLELGGSTNGSRKLLATGTALRFASVAAMKAATVGGASLAAAVSGYYEEGDGGGGLFFYDPSITTAGDDFLVFTPTNGSGRWLRDSSGPISVNCAGCFGDGLTDYTARLHVALAALTSGGGVLYFPAGTYILTPVTWTSNVSAVFSPKAILQAKTGYTANQRLLNLVSVSRVTLQGNHAEVKMLKAEYASGEQRHGVMILSSTDITVYDLHSNDAGGDGFLVGSVFGTQTPSQRISLVNCYANNNRRQGLSITSAVDTWVIGGKFSNTTGTAPSAGVDIEPDDNDTIQNVNLIGVKTSGNDGSGIIVVPRRAGASAGAYFSVNIIGGSSDDDGAILVNDAGLRFDCGAAPSNQIDGAINVRDFTVFNANGTGLSVGAGSWSLCPALNIDNVQILNPCATNAGATVDQAGVSISTTFSSTNTTNIHFRNVKVADNRGAKKMLHPFLLSSAGAAILTDSSFVDCDDNSLSPYATPFVVLTSGVARVTVSQTAPRLIALGAGTIDIFRYAGQRLTHSASGVLSLGDPGVLDGLEYEFENTSGTLSQIRPLLGDTILGLGVVSQGDVISRRAGDRIVLRAVAPDTWRIVSLYGRWAPQGTQPAGAGQLYSSPPKTLYGTAAPTALTWAVGDRLIQIIPVVGQPKSWVCTVAGTPGTWVSEGNL